MPDLPPLARRLVAANSENLTVRQLALLITVSTTPGESVASLAAALGVPKATITRATDKLEMVGLLRRETDRTDQRRVCITATIAGHTVAALAEG